jgi:Reverse transcriptase (RNA-dependent DNA polymerase)
LPTINPVDADSVFEQVEKANGEHADSSNDEDEPPPLVRRPDDSDDEDESPYAARCPGEEANSDDEDDTPIPVASQLPPILETGRTVLMPIHPDGTCYCPKIVERVDKYKESLDVERAKNAQYRVLMEHADGEKWTEVVAYNDLVRLINDEDDGAEADEDGTWRFKRILSHTGPLCKGQQGYNGSAWNVHVLWETGEITIEPLKIVEHDKYGCAAYAHDKPELLEQPGWKQFKKHAQREKKLVRMVNQAKLQSFRTALVYMYGHLVPRNHSQALEIDRKNGNAVWQDAEKIELEAILGYGVFNDTGLHTSGPENHKRINVHFVYAVKHDGRYKARLVAGGHLTDTPIDSVYSSVATLWGVRMVMFLVELNGLNFWSTDIGNAYLESNTMEKIYIVGGKEFTCVGLEGHTLVIVKALYGLKSSGTRWWEVLANVLRQMGFTPSKADNDIWMRRVSDLYEYVVVYVDDLGIASSDPSSIIKELEGRYGFQLKGTGPTTFHLGCNYF